MTMVKNLQELRDYIHDELTEYFRDDAYEILSSTEFERGIHAGKIRAYQEIDNILRQSIKYGDADAATGLVDKG